jgi:hypothetical protein
MDSDAGLVPILPQPPRHDLARAGSAQLPPAIARAGWRFIEFFTANIREAFGELPRTLDRKLSIAR